ncbi:PGPGW domain-containing protein [uncultured Cellulomonas sp.]|uniref:PGPGW domain-containing protein n=1 Tax=uncultured Cellulomonas sp. TaxID=189682 RepID=UPI00261B2B8B|nr:PGPGW domain-containing protein [uncultured Cellulomonas sp.]
MKRVMVAIVGGALALAGIALLVLPGPGFVLVAAGLAILATQFAWAARPLAYAKGKASTGMDEVAHSWPRAAVAILAAMALLAVGILGMAGVDLPFVNVFTASLLVVSGVALLGTLVYARRRAGAAQRRPVVVDAER